MRIVQVDLLCSSPFYVGGVAVALRDAGADVELASPRFYLEPDAMDGYPRAPWIVDLVVHASRPRPVRLAIRAVELLANTLRLAVRVARGRYDVVHVQWIPLEHRSTVFMRLLRAACDRSGTLLVLTVHNVMPHEAGGANRAVFRRNLDRAHLILTLTDHVATELGPEIGTRTPIETTPLGPMFIDRALPPRAEAAARLGRTIAPTVLFLGLMRAYKGVDVLADAWPEVRAAVPDARLLVVGKVFDAAIRPDLDRLRAQPGVTIVEGYVSVAQMLDSYAVADLVVFPYHLISQSAGLMTAAGLGRPVVITPVEGLLEQARTLTSAVVADEVSGPAIARALIGALDRTDEILAAAERDRLAILDSPIGSSAVARATLDAYATHRRRPGST